MNQLSCTNGCFDFGETLGYNEGRAGSASFGFHRDGSDRIPAFTETVERPSVGDSADECWEYWVDCLRLVYRCLDQ